MTSGEVIFGILQKRNDIEEWRNLMGETVPEKAAKGTIRNKYGYKEENSIYNTVHGSDSTQSFYREIEIWYGKKYICEGCGKFVEEDDFYQGLPLCGE